ncbi:MAG: response regulator [Ketobacter sp.]
MSNKLALVVDDSRMARYVLSKMLTEQGIDVDSVESGEEALGYLCGKKPSMIFMDHTMPGMDGFQCLRAIKNDPQTANIPIIMYTSKEGEVYESQARALGAVDIIPKTLKPLMLTKVLERQNLLPNQAGVEYYQNAVGQAANDVVIVDAYSDQAYEPEPPAALSEAKKHASATEEEHPELEVLEQRIEQLTSQLSGINKSGNSFEGRFSRLQYLGLALCVVFIAWLLLNNNQLSQKMTTLETDRRSLQESLDQQSQQNVSVKSQLEKEIQGQASLTNVYNKRFYESIEWALNEAGDFEWNYKPFNDKLATTLTQLAENLDSVGFVGKVDVRSHLGRFCLQTKGNGEPALPEPGQTLNNCEITQLSPSMIDSVGTEQTPTFERFLAAFESEYGEGIDLELSTEGDRQPIVRYPSEDSSMDAERWNKFASRNQRIEVSITPY